MEGWMLFWSVVLYAGLGLFVIMSVYVTIFGFRDIRRMLSELQRQSAAAQSAAGWINNILGVGGGGLMTIGQMAEIAVLALIPLVAKRISRKTLLAVGIIAYAARMALFAYAADYMSAVLLGVALHGRRRSGPDFRD